MGIKTNSGWRQITKAFMRLGDCIETVSLINHRPTMMQLSSAAYRQGWWPEPIAAGGYDIYEGALGTFCNGHWKP